VFFTLTLFVWIIFFGDEVRVAMLRTGMTMPEVASMLNEQHRGLTTLGNITILTFERCRVDVCFDGSGRVFRVIRPALNNVRRKSTVDLRFIRWTASGFG
jgi:hypothetical protein